MISNREVIDRIDFLLKQRHLKRNAVYDYVGIARNTFSNWSKNENVKIPAQPLFEIAQYFGVSVEYLLTGKEPEEKELVPYDVLELAFEINALPEVYKKIVFDTVQTLKSSATEQEKEEQQNIG